jgi:hypothetical protein
MRQSAEANQHLIGDDLRPSQFDLTAFRLMKVQKRSHSRPTTQGHVSP